MQVSLVTMLSGGLFGFEFAAFKAMRTLALSGLDDEALWLAEGGGTALRSRSRHSVIFLVLVCTSWIVVGGGAAFSVL